MALGLVQPGKDTALEGSNSRPPYLQGGHCFSVLTYQPHINSRWYKLWEEQLSDMMMALGGSFSSVYRRWNLDSAATQPK